MRAPFIALFAVFALSACGQVPHPFIHDSVSDAALLKQPLPPISVAEIQGLPGLNDAIIKAFDHEDIPATRVVSGNAFLRMNGVLAGVGKPQLRWQITDGKGKELGAFDQAFAPSTPLTELAEGAVAQASKLLRADDLGASDLAARPKVKIASLTVTGTLDAEQLKRALTAALERQGIAVVTSDAPFLVIGSVRITQGLAGHDLVEVTWIVNDDKNVEIGKVNQGSPTQREELLAQAAVITRQIAEGGAEGIRQLVRLKAPAAAGKP